MGVFIVGAVIWTVGLSMLYWKNNSTFRRKNANGKLRYDNYPQKLFAEFIDTALKTCSLFLMGLGIAILLTSGASEMGIAAIAIIVTTTWVVRKEGMFPEIEKRS
jgi:hypothetical protein